MVGIETILKGLVADLRELKTRWALVGGLAVSVRAEPRTTRDIDAAVAVEADIDAECLVRDLRARGYDVEAVIEQENTGRLATARLIAPGGDEGGVIVDLLFSSSGIEPEIILSADLLEVLPDITAPVATVSHLLATKALAGRAKDLADIESLLDHAAPVDLAEADSLLRLIVDRGYGRDKDLAELRSTLRQEA